MNQNDINRAFTEKVAELLSRGYQIYPGTMNGSQGEIAHVDLYRGDEIIRVLLDQMCIRDRVSVPALSRSTSMRSGSSGYNPRI